MGTGGTQEHRQVARGGGDHVVVLSVGEGAGLHVSAVAGELVEASDHDVALGLLHNEGLDVASRAKFFTEADQAVQLGLGAGSDNPAVHNGHSPHVASEAQLVALELDVVAEALVERQLEAGPVDVDELELDAKLTNINDLCRTRRKKRLDKLEDRTRAR